MTPNCFSHGRPCRRCGKNPIRYGGICEECGKIVKAAPWRETPPMSSKVEARKYSDSHFRGQPGHRFKTKVVPRSNGRYVVKYKQVW